MKRIRKLSEMPLAQQLPPGPPGPPGPTNPPAPAPVPSISTKTLEYIRNDALQNVSRSRALIAELDALRADIDATIAFLRAQHK